MNSNLNSKQLLVNFSKCSKEGSFPTQLPGTEFGCDAVVFYKVPSNDDEDDNNDKHTVYTTTMTLNNIDDNHNQRWH